MLMKVRIQLKTSAVQQQLQAATVEYERCFNMWLLAGLDFYDEDEYNPTDFLEADMEMAKIYMEHCQRQYDEAMATEANNRTALDTRYV